MSYLALSARESSLVQTFCESCVRLDITHQSVHMARRFVIQGCPTLIHSKIAMNVIILGVWITSNVDFSSEILVSLELCYTKLFVAVLQKQDKI